MNNVIIYWHINVSVIYYHILPLSKYVYNISVHCCDALNSLFRIRNLFFVGLDSLYGFLPSIKLYPKWIANTNSVSSHKMKLIIWFIHSMNKISILWISLCLSISLPIYAYAHRIPHISGASFNLFKLQNLQPSLVETFVKSILPDLDSTLDFDENLTLASHLE